MLYLDDQKIDAQELATMFGVDLVGLAKKANFELDKSLKFVDRANGNVTKVGNGQSLRPKITAYLPGTMKRVEIRYATTKTVKKDSGGNSFEYLPRYIDIKGASFTFKNNIELSLFLVLHTNNSFSPLRKKGERYRTVYEFVDDHKRAIQRLDTITAKTKALRHAETADIATLSLLAKYLRVSGVDEMSDQTLRVTMMEVADNPTTTAKYSEAIDSHAALSEGRIINLVNKGAIAARNLGSGMSQWIWKSGPREGQVIGDIVMNGSDPMKYLINFLMSSLHVYERDILETSDTLTAKEKAEAFYRTKESNQSAPIVSAEGPSIDEDYVRNTFSDVELPDWNDWKGLTEYIKSKGYKASPASQKVMKDLGLSGEIDNSNIEVYMSQNLAKAE